MTEAKHTPGPWHLGGMPRTGWFKVIGSDGHMLMEITGEVMARSIGESKANTNLVIAAPDMLEALKAVDALWSKDAELGFEEEMAITSPVGLAWEKVRAAIAKATGAK